MRRNIIRSIFIAVAITGAAFLVFGSGKTGPSASNPCEESMEQCCKKKKSKAKGADYMIREIHSGQFFTFTGL